MELKNIIKTLKSIKNPLEFRKFIFSKLISIIYRENKGFYVLNENWDNLIILDACRFDFFKTIIKRSNIDGKLESRISRGAHTTSFLTQNFKGKKCDDLIYITANPYVDKLFEGNFYKIVSIWKDGWNEKYHTVLPETVYQYSLNIIKNFPKKRIIIHFMQPHYPYINTDIELTTLESLRESTLQNTPKINDKLKKARFKEKFWALYSYYVYKMLDVDTHIKGYWKNLQLTFPYVEKIVKLLPGTTIITADHGEAFGEYIHPWIPIRYYGHRKGVRIPILTKVPWFIVNPETSTDKDKQDLIEKEILRNKITKLKIKGDI